MTGAWAISQCSIEKRESKPFHTGCVVFVVFVFRPSGYCKGCTVPVDVQGHSACHAQCESGVNERRDFQRRLETQFFP